MCMRISSMMQTVAPLEKRIFGETVGQDTCMALVSTKLHTKTFYTSGTWSWLPERVKVTLRNAVTKVLKVVANMHATKEMHWTEDLIYDEMNARASRSLSTRGSPILWALAEATADEVHSCTIMSKEDLH
jgi:hypothetical protein